MFQAMLAAAEVSGVVDQGPWIGIVSQLIGWTFGIIFVLVLFSAMKKSFIYGFSYKIAELLINLKDESAIRRIVRWFENGDDLLEILTEIRDKLKVEEAPGSPAMKKGRGKTNDDDQG